MEALLDEIVAKYNYWIYVVLMMIGFYAMIGKRNLVKKLIGMNIFQTAIILFFVSTGVKKGGAIPIVDKYQALAGNIDAASATNKDAFRVMNSPRWASRNGTASGMTRSTHGGKNHAGPAMLRAGVPACDLMAALMAFALRLAPEGSQ